jgi:hypothetical protein
MNLPNVEKKNFALIPFQFMHHIYYEKDEIFEF